MELVTDNVRDLVGRIRRIRPATSPQRLRTLQAVSRVQARHAPPTVLTGRIGPCRKLLILRQPLEELRTQARANQCTINGLLLAEERSPALG